MVTGRYVAASGEYAIQQSLPYIQRAVSGQLRAIGEIFTRPSLDVGRRTLMHDRIARDAQYAVADAYTDRVENPARAKGTSGYRTGDRYSGGVLRDAILSPDFYEATADGIYFINGSMLSVRAAQWKRLNFGAGAAGGETYTPRRYELVWSGLVVASLGLSEGVQPGFGMPQGYWIGSQFHVGDTDTTLRYNGPGGAAARSQRRKTETRGIAARQFLEDGLQTIVTLMPGEYQAWYRELYEEAKAGFGPLTQITAFVRPAHQHTRVQVT